MSYWFDPMVQTVGMPGYGGGPQINTDYGGQLAQQQAYVAAQNQAALYAARPTPYGYGFVTSLAPSFGKAAAPGTYSPGSGRSSYSGVSLGGGGGQQAPGGGGGMTMGSDGQFRWAPEETAPSSGVIGGWYNPYGGGGGYPQPQAAVPRQPQLSQDWNTSFNNMTAGNSYNPYYLGGSSWYPSQRTPYSGGGIGSDAAAAPSQPAIDPSYSANYLRAGGGFYGGGLAYGQPSASPGYHNPGSYAGDQSNYGIPFNGRPMAGDIGYSARPSYPNLGYNPGMSNWFANPGMGGGAFQGRFGMGFPNAGTPSQYAPGAQMPPGFSRMYDVDNPGGALPLGFSGSATTGGGL